jgi:alpha-1,2-mannosyltransferase
MPVSRNIRLAIFGIAAMTPPALEDLNLGNVSLIVTFLTVVVWRFADRPLAAVALAGSLLLRPTMAVIGLVWLLRRKFRPAIWTAVAFAAMVIATLPFVGFRGWFEYATVLRNVSDVTGVPRNFDMASFVLGLGAPAWLPGLVLLGGFAIAIGAVLVSLRRDWEVGFVVAVGASLLLSPLLWNHYVTHVLITAAFLASRGRWWGIALPLLTWLPQEMLGFLAVAMTLLPFAARDPQDASAAASDLRQPVPSPALEPALL